MTDKKVLCIAASAAAAVGLPLFMLAPGKSAKTQKAPFIGRNFAHRGLHSKDKLVPENSLAAFRLAAEAGYGMELDVQLSKDGQVVVFHDDTLDRVCGVHARVDEKTYNDLRQYRLCGSDEHIPLFTDVLNVIDGKGPLIVELKNGRRNRELCKKTYDILSSYRGQVCIESFNPIIVAWFRFHVKELIRGQLAAQKGEYDGQTGKAAAFLLSRCLMNFISRPQFIAYRIGKKPLTVKLSELMGAMRFCWTSHGAENEKGRDAVIFEFYRPPLKFK